MDVSILLASETVPLRVDQVEGQGKPIDLIPIGSIPDEIRQSFLSGGLAVYNALQRQRQLIACTMFSYRIEAAIANRLYGGSGALAFAIAAMFAMVNRPNQQNIGATGAIEDITGGQIRAVSQVEEKLTYAVQQMTGGVLFYPQDNDHEITQELREDAKDRDIILFGVTCIDDVVTYFFPPVTKHYTKCYLVIALSILIIGWLAYGSLSPLLARYLLERNRSTLASYHLHVARYIAFWNRDLRDLYFEVYIPFRAQTTFIILFKTGIEQHYPIDRLPFGLSLDVGDVFAFQVHASLPVYVYIYQFNADYTVRKLYPHDAEPAEPTQTSTLPGKGQWFNTTGLRGKTDIHIVLSRWRRRDLETLASPGDLQCRTACQEVTLPGQVRRITFMAKNAE